MKNRFWQIIARFITARLQRVDCIVRAAQRNPYSQLRNRDGSDYMGRWWLMPRWLLTRDETGHLFPLAWLPFIARVHHRPSYSACC